MANYRIRIGEEWQSIYVKGRDEWALRELMSMGELGTTPIANPAPRWSSYVFNLRRLGRESRPIQGGPHLCVGRAVDAAVR